MREHNKDFGKDCCFGYHADLHLWDTDFDAGTRANPDELEACLRLIKPDWVQVDSKGHAGYASWFSKVPESTVAPHLAHDAVAAWREATRRLELKVFSHYSGFLDLAAARKHPEWLAVLPPGQKRKEPLEFRESWMCPRSDYFDRLMIPQLIELAVEVGMDGFWIDGDVWGFQGCWCPKCVAEFTRRTGIGSAPSSAEEPNWKEWCQFTSDSYFEVLRHYLNAVKAAAPGVLFCVNWLETTRYPAGTPEVDWLSGDICGCSDEFQRDIRWIANRGKSWDMMSWPHLGFPNFHLKSHDMLCQESASVIAAGGRYIMCEYSGGIRTSQQTPWRLRRLAKIGDFVRERAPFCRSAAGVPEVAVLLTQEMPIFFRYQPETATRAAKELLNVHYQVDLLDEKILLPRLDDFKVVVLPESGALAPATIAALKSYVKRGGRLLATGVDTITAFGLDFFGIASMTVEDRCPQEGKIWSFEQKKDATPQYFLSDGDDGVFPLASPKWGFAEPAPDTECGEDIYSSYIPEESATGRKAIFCRRHGNGMAAAVPADFFAGFSRHHFLPETGKFLKRLMLLVYPVRDIEVKASSLINVMFRTLNGKLLIHLLNVSSGTASNPERWMIDEIPPIGPIELKIRRNTKPVSVRLLPEGLELPWEWCADAKSGVAKIIVPSVRIHSAVEVE